MRKGQAVKAELKEQELAADQGEFKWMGLLNSRDGEFCDPLDAYSREIHSQPAMDVRFRLTNRASPDSDLFGVLAHTSCFKGEQYDS
jgi:hypothetical protein